MDFFEAPMQWIEALGFAMPRLMGVFTILPLVSRDALPMTLRAGVVSCLAMLVVPTLLDAMAREHHAIETVLILVREVSLGALIGFVLAIPMWAVEAMGDIIDTQRGANMSQMLNPLTGHEASPLGLLFNQAIVTFLFVTGGFTLAVRVVYDSYALWPVFSHWPGLGHDAPAVLLAQMDHLMRLTVLLASPAVFAMFLSESGLALVSRFVPQLQVFFLAMPIKSAVAFIVLAIYAAVLFDTANTVLGDAFADALPAVGRVFLPVRVR
jgi:type III secretion protein T